MFTDKVVYYINDYGNLGEVDDFQAKKEIVNETSTILHIIQVLDILEVLNHFRGGIDNSTIKKNEFLLNEIEILEAKITD